MLNATLIKRINITSELMVIHVRPDKGVDSFIPGQYVALGLMGSSPRPDNFPPEPEPPMPDKLIKRAYSIGSSPDTKDYLEFYISVLPTGLLTARLMCLKEGDRIYCAPKIAGTFTLHDAAPENNVVFVATGTGLAPFMSMLRTESTWTEGRKITMVHGVRFRRDLAYRDELLDLCEKRRALSYYAFVSRDEPEPGLIEKGYVQNLFKEERVSLNPLRDNVFLCGNPGMIDEVEKMLVGRGYIVHSKKTPGTLHHEKYW